MHGGSTELVLFAFKYLIVFEDFTVLFMFFDVFLYNIQI